jgi:hypothetical protein
MHRHRAISEANSQSLAHIALIVRDYEEAIA